MRPTTIKLTLSYDRAEIWQALEASGDFVTVEREGRLSLLFLEFSGYPSPEIRRKLVQGVRDAWSQMDPTATVGVIHDSGARVKFHLFPEEVIIRVLKVRLAIQLQKQLGQ